MLAFTIQYSLIFRRNCLFYYRPLKTHGFAVRLTVSRTISRSHDEAQKSHGKVKQSQADGIHFSNIPFLPRKNWFPGVNSVEIHSSKAYSSYLIVLLTGYGPQKPSKPYFNIINIIYWMRLRWSVEHDIMNYQNRGLCSGAPNENIVQNYLYIALLNVF